MVGPEEDAILKAIDGDPTELQVMLLRQCSRLAQRFHGAIPNDLQHQIDIDDLLQETCLRAIRQIHSLTWNGLESFEAWLNEIAKNCLIDLIRACRRRKRGGGVIGMPLSWIGVAELLRAGEANADGQRPSGSLHRRELIEAMQKAVRTLPEREQTAIRLSYLEQIATDVAAEQLSITPGAFRALLQRARKRLQKVLHESAW